MNKRFDTGKQPYDAAKDTRATAPSRKPADILRLSTRSTRENPRLLGGTLDHARDYLDNLPEQQREEYNKFNRVKSYYSNIKDSNGTQIAKAKHPIGHAIYLEYKKKLMKPEDEGSASDPSIKQLNDAVIQEYPGYKEKIAKQAKEWQDHIKGKSKKR